MSTSAKTQEQVERQVRAKEAQRKAFLKGRGNAPRRSTEPLDPDLPPNQKWSRGDKWVVIDNRTTNFAFEVESWELQVEGLEASQPSAFSKRALLDLSGGEQLFPCNIHCVTQCSVRVRHPFRGVSMRKLLSALQPQEGWKWLVQHGKVGNLPPLSMNRIINAFQSCLLTSSPAAICVLLSCRMAILRQSRVRR